MSAKAGIQFFQSVKNSWTPVFTGVTTFYDFIKFVFCNEAFIPLSVFSPSFQLCPPARLDSELCL